MQRTWGNQESFGPFPDRLPSASLPSGCFRVLSFNDKPVIQQGRRFSDFHELLYQLHQTQERAVGTSNLKRVGWKNGA